MTKIQARIVALFLIIAALGCQLPFTGPSAPEPTTTANPAQAIPTSLPVVNTAEPFPTPLPTLPRSSATPTVKALDLSSVVVRLNELPQGFQELDRVTQTQIGLTEETLSAFFQGSFKNAKPGNYFAFLNPASGSFEVLVGMLFSPLSNDEKVTLDAEMSDPQKAKQNFDSGFGGSAEILKGAETVGEKSIGFTFTTESGAVTLRGEMVMARRGEVAFVVLVLYQDGKKPLVTVVEVGTNLDGKLKAALSR